MNKSQFEALNQGLLDYSKAQSEFVAAQQKLWNSMFPAITRVIALLGAEGRFVSLGHIVSGVNALVSKQYRSAPMQKRLKPGRHLHDAHIVLAVDTENKIIHDAILWALQCEVIGHSINGYVVKEKQHA